jgi:hypothetical protein
MLLVLVVAARGAGEVRFDERRGVGSVVGNGSLRSAVADCAPLASRPGHNAQRDCAWPG